MYTQIHKHTPVHWSTQHMGSKKASETCRYLFCLFVKYFAVHICILIWFAGWVEQLLSSSLSVFLCLLMCECADSSSGVYTKQTKWILFLWSTNKLSCNWLFNSQFSLFYCPVSVIRPSISIVSGFSAVIWQKYMNICNYWFSFFKTLNLNQPRALRARKIQMLSWKLNVLQRI